MKILKKKSGAQQRYGNLDEVMNFNVPFQIIYSGVENDSYFDILYDLGIRNFLMSYHYIQTKHLSLHTRFERLGNIRLLIDSGAHTYQNDPKYQDFGIEYWENHLKGYLKWAEKNKDYLFAIVNFDFENLVGAEQVDKWNKEYFEPFMLRTGIPVCFVWHQNSYNSWEYYCKRYPYVGFSSVNTEGVAIDLAEYKEKLRVAERNNSLVHGFGMTRTSMLTELPFYTADSTTWLVGLQYGEVNYWTGSKMSRLKKDAWKGTYLEEICNRYNLDAEKMQNEDVTELIKANIGAFIDAEQYVQTRLKHLMYWMKAKAVKTDIDSLSDSDFPSPEWLISDSNEGLEEYCKRFNINPEYEGARSILFDLTVFLNWDNPTYKINTDWYKEEAQEQLINELHDEFINRIVPDKEAKIQDLIAFYKECASGENDKLLHLGTNFDRTIRERESYIEEEDTELVELSPEEIQSRIGNLLPDKSVEEAGDMIQAMDAEIFKKAEIVPTFDENGKFVKGHQLARKRKDVYSNKYPKLACDTCINAAKCPEYKSGYACAYNKMFKRFDTRNMDDLIDAMQGIVSFNMERMQRSMIGEMLNGVIDPVTSQLMDTNLRYINTLKSMYESAGSEMIRQTQVVRSDGSRETTTAVNVNPQNNSIMEKLLSGLMQSSKDTPEESKQAETENNEIVVDNIDG